VLALAAGGRRGSERMAAMGRGNARVTLPIVGLVLLVFCLPAASASAAVSFTRAWGWGVGDGAEQFETCTSACQQGLFGGGAGEFYNPYGVAIDPSGNVYVADVSNLRVQEFSSAGTFIKAWGWGVSDGADQFETCTSACQAGLAGGGPGQLFFPWGVAVDPSGNVYVTDANNHRVDEFSSAGAFIKAWGWGVSDGADQLETCTSACQTGIGGSAAGQLYSPQGVAVDSSANVYVTDANNRVQEFSSAGAFIKAWGWGVSDGADQLETCNSACQTGIGGSAAGQLYSPTGVAVDSSANVYVTDSSNRVQEFSSAGAFIKAWGWGVSDGADQLETCTSACQAGLPGDGAGQFSSPYGVAVDPSGNVYVTDVGNNRVQEFSSAGTFIKAWGWGVSDGADQLETCTSACHGGRGGGGAGGLTAPSGVAVDPSGNVYVTDVGNSRVQEFAVTAEPPPVIGKQATAAVEKGLVRVKLPGKKGFVTLTQTRSIPVGSVFDTTKGQVALTFATNATGGTQRGSFSRGQFRAAQSRKNPLTTISMVGGGLDRCKTKLPKGGARKPATASARKRHRTLFSNVKGHFRTRGRHSTATVRGTKWSVTDTCAGTKTSVTQGSVLVRDLTLRRNVLVAAGHSYFARAPLRKKNHH
jgi:sugar lactone lactonase YvrE